MHIDYGRLRAARPTLDDLLTTAANQARADGFEGLAWTPTPEEIAKVVAEFGRKPTRAEWSAAGLLNVGSDHVAEE